MLRMLGSCELCGGALAPDAEAWICSYECTYCPTCAAKMTQCPNCAGEVVRRPRRTTGVVAITTRLPARVIRHVVALARR